MALFDFLLCALLQISKYFTLLLILLNKPVKKQSLLAPLFPIVAILMYLYFSGQF